MWREIHNLSMLTFPSAPTTCCTCRKATVSSESQLSSLDTKTQLTAFSQISAHASGAWHHSHLLVTFPIWGFILTSVNDAWTPALMLHLTNPCTKLKVLSLTKPKSQIYKTKFLGHYITMLMIIRKSDLSDKIKWELLHLVISLLQHGYIA